MIVINVEIKTLTSKLLLFVMLAAILIGGNIILFSDRSRNDSGEPMAESEQSIEHYDSQTEESDELTTDEPSLSEEALAYFSQLEEDINALVAQYGTNVGISYYDINSGYEISINGDESYVAASTIKVALNMVLFDKIYEGGLSADKILYYTDDDYEGGAGILQESDLSQGYDIMTLSEYSITHSDNIATQMIKRYINESYDLFTEYDNLLGYTTEHEGNPITPNDATAYLKRLYENPDDNPYYEFIIDNMKNTIYNTRMDRYIDNSLVAHKVGDYNGYVNDIGIVYADNPFILSVYVDNLDNADEIISELTLMIYDAQNDEYPSESSN